MPTSDHVITKLNEHHGRSESLRFAHDACGLIYAVLTHQGAEARVYLQGAHVTHYQPADQEPVLFTSEKSRFAKGEPMRGGVPLCFPWFAQHLDNADLPMHGFARTFNWKVSETFADADNVGIELLMRSTGRTEVHWPHRFVATHRVALVNAQLVMTFRVKNLDSAGSRPFTYEAAQHSYFIVSDASQVEISGLESATYIDKVDQFKRKMQGQQPIRFTGETDRIYLKSPQRCALHDPGLARRIVVTKENADATVIWNPWIKKAKAMADFGDSEWQHMACIETCNVADHRVTLAFGESHEMTTTIKVER